MTFPIATEPWSIIMQIGIYTFAETTCAIDLLGTKAAPAVRRELAGHGG
jgi:hypothetical protein